MQQESQPTHLQELGSGLGATVFYEKRGDEEVVRKVFGPHWVAQVGHRIVRFREHPYTASYNDSVVAAAFELRRVAHRISRAISDEIEVVDATELSPDRLAFYSPYIRGEKYDKRKNDIARKLDEFETHFDRMGLPVWSFGGFQKNYKRTGNVKIGENGKIFIIDYESGIPFFSSRHFITFDNVDILRFDTFLGRYAGVLQGKLGEKGHEELRTAWKQYVAHNALWRGKERAPVRMLQTLRESTTSRSLYIRVNTLLADGRITDDDAERMRKAIVHNSDLLRRIQPHLLAHIAISSLPTGGKALRPMYTGIMRAVSEVANRWNKDTQKNKMQIHNVKVAVGSMLALPVLPGVPYGSLPMPGYLAYLTNLSKTPLSLLLWENIL